MKRFQKLLLEDVELRKESEKAERVRQKIREAEEELNRGGYTISRSVAQFRSQRAETKNMQLKTHQYD